MTQPVDARSRELIAGLLLSQQVLVEALVRHDAIGYPQLRGTFEKAIAALGETAPPASVEALRSTFRVLDDLHRPLGPDERPHAADWAMRLQALLRELA